MSRRLSGSLTELVRGARNYFLYDSLELRKKREMETFYREFKIDEKALNKRLNANKSKFVGSLVGRAVANLVLLGSLGYIVHDEPNIVGLFVSLIVTGAGETYRNLKLWEFEEYYQCFKLDKKSMLSFESKKMLERRSDPANSWKQKDLIDWESDD